MHIDDTEERDVPRQLATNCLVRKASSKVLACIHSPYLHSRPADLLAGFVVFQRVLQSSLDQLMQQCSSLPHDVAGGLARVSEFICWHLDTHSAYQCRLQSLIEVVRRRWTVKATRQLNRHNYSRLLPLERDGEHWAHWLLDKPLVCLQYQHRDALTETPATHHRHTASWRHGWR